MKSYVSNVETRVLMRALFCSACVAVAYFATGLLGLNLALPPGYASAVFPASGIALASLLLFGRSYFFVIMVASTAMNLYVASKSGPPTPFAALICFIIGLGAGLQALFGSWLIKRAKLNFRALHNEYTIFKFLMLAGPVSCLLNSTWSVSALTGFDILNASSFGYNWIMWYVGDAVGVMIFTPIVLALLEDGRFKLTVKKRLAVVPSLFLFILVIGFFFFSSHQLNEKLKAHLRAESESGAHRIDEAMEKYETILAGTERFFASSDSVTPAEFHKFLQSSLERNPGLRAVSWVPFVPANDREKFETSVRRAGLPNFAIREASEEGLKPAYKREHYYPVRYIEPIDNNTSALGFDLLSSPPRRASVDLAFSTRQAVITPRVQFVQDNETLPSIAMYYPVFRADGGRRGVIAGLFNAKTLLESALANNHLQDLNFEIHDVTDGARELLYDRYAAPLERLAQTDLRTRSSFSHLIEINHRNWEFTLIPSARYLTDNADLTAWALLVGGLIMVVLLQSLLMIILGRTSLVEEIVDERTLELSTVNKELARVTKLISLDLKESHLNFQQLAESMPQIVWILDPSGSVTYINDHWHDYTGVAIDAQPWSDMLHPDDLEPTLKILSNSLATGIPYEQEYRLRSKDGGYRWILARGIPIMNADQQIQKWFGTCTDIHEQKKASWEAFQSQQHMQAVIANLPVAMWTTDANGTITWSAGRPIGSIKVNARHNIGANIFELAKHLPEALASVKRALVGESLTYETDADGAALECYFTPLRDLNGQAAGLVAFMMDVTDKKSTAIVTQALEVRERLAIEASKLKSAFLANMSHEIRTPINGVVGMAGLLRDTNLSEEQDEYASNIESSGKSLLRIINDILDFSKVEAGKLDLEIIDFDFEMTIREAFKNAEFMARPKNLPLLLDFAALPLTSLRGDRGRLTQILSNLLNNAAKFTAHGGITLSVQALAPVERTYSYRISIQDTGIGLTKASIDKIFQPFDQADSTTARRFGGTGLGLSICKQLVELMGGKIGVESEFGRGSTFWFELQFEVGVTPLATFRQSNREVETRQLSARVLLAEDNPVNQIVASKQLQKIGCSYDVVGNGIEALEALRRFTYDIVLMDCQMPEMDGYEATRRIRNSDGPYREIPIIAMTANAMQGDREKCIEVGMNDYVTKPISISELSGALRKWMPNESAIRRAT